MKTRRHTPMNKQKGSWRNSSFFLIGSLLYSLIFWFAKKDIVVALLLIILGMLCTVLYWLSSSHSGKKFTKTKDILYINFGIITNALLGGFPFNLMPLI